MKNKILVNLLLEREILKHGNFKLRNGSTSSYYCDIKESFGNPEILNIITKKLILLVPKKATCIVGYGYGGITLASIVAYRMKLPLVLVRDQVKRHGTKKMIDGYIPNKRDYCCIVDDVFTSGSSIHATKEKLKDTRCKFTKPLVVLDRSTRNSVISILKSRDLLK